MRNRSRALTVCLFLLAGLTFVGLVWAQPESADDVLARARQQFERHNYKQAVELLDGLLARDADNVAAVRLRIIAHCRWNEPHNDQWGWQYGQEALKTFEALRQDPLVWDAMGENALGQYRNAEAYEFSVKALELYKQAGQFDEFARASFRAAEALTRDYDILPQQRETDDWQKKMALAQAEALKLLDAVADEAKVSTDLRCEALYRGAQVLRNRGDLQQAEQAVQRLRRAVAEFGRAKLAVDCQRMIGDIYQQFGRYVEAVEAYQKVVADWPESRHARDARRLIQEIRKPQIQLYAIEPYLPGAKAVLYWNIRNVKELNLTAYRVDLHKVVAAMGQDKNAQDVVNVAYSRFRGEAVARWSFQTPDEGKHQFHHHRPPQPEDDQPLQTTQPIDVPFSEAGAYLVVASGKNAFGQSEDGSALVIFSAISAVAKADGDNGLVFAADAQTGAPVEGATVLWWRNGVRDAQRNRTVVTGEGVTDDAGLCWLDGPRMQNFQWLVVASRGDDQALCTDGNWWHGGWWGYGQGLKVYGFTERPVYRPGHTVHFKQILRRHEEGKYANLPDTKVQVEIRNPKGETVYSKELITDRFGAVEGDLAIAEAAPLGVWHIQVRAEGTQLGYWQSPGNQFRVEEYRKPEFEVTVSPAEPSYRVGDDMQIVIHARYYFGQPVAGAKVAYRIRKQNDRHHFEWPVPYPWYRQTLDEQHGLRWWWWPQFDELVVQGEGVTDAEGNLKVAVKAEPIAGHEDWDLKFLVHAEVTDPSRRTVEGDGTVRVTHKPFFVHLKPAQAVYQPGDSVEIEVKTANPSGQPVPGEFTAQAWRVERVRKTVTDEQTGKEKVEIEEKLAQKLFEKPLTVGPEGRATFRFVPDVSAEVKVLVFTEDKQLVGEAGRVEGAVSLFVAERSGALAHYAYGDLQLVPAKDQYEIGQTMTVLVNTRFADANVLLTGEGDGIYFRRVVAVRDHSVKVDLPIDEALCPNFTLSAVMLRENKVFFDTKDIVVPPTHKFIKVVAALADGQAGGKPNTFGPREKTTVKLTLTDVRTGQPVRGAVTLMMVDSAVYYIQPEFRQAIEKDFYGHVRPLQVSTSTSFGAGAGQPPRPFRRGFGGQMAETGILMDQAGARMEMMPAAAEPMMAKAAEAPSPAPPGEAPAAAPIVREEFADTVLWAGSVVADADGVAAIEVTMPDQLTTFALHAIAFDEQTLVGQTEVDVVTTKNIIVRLQAPRFFTEGDQSYVTLIAHNYFDRPAPLKLDLTGSDQMSIRRVWTDGRWVDYTAGAPVEVTVPAGDEVRVDFLAAALHPGEVTLTAQALGAAESDATRLRLPILPWGAAKLSAASGILRGQDETLSAAAALTVPEEIRRNSQSLTVTLSPSVAGVALESLPFLAKYPYGCVEQTMSRFMPLVLVRKTLADSGIDLGEVKKLLANADPKRQAYFEMLRKKYDRNPVYDDAAVEKMIAVGLARLAEFQRGDGGWGWWKQDESNPYITAYVVYGLSLARDADVKLPDNMLARGAVFLAKRAAEDAPAQRWPWALDNDNVRAFMLFALASAEPNRLDDAKLQALLNRLYEQRDDLTDYGRAYLALTLHAAGQKDKAGIVVENFDNTAILDEKAGDAHWGKQRGWWWWYEGDIETTAWVLQAMLTVAPDDKYVPMAVKYLVHNRRDGYWYNTKTTAMAVYALMRYAKTAGELDCDQQITVTLDGQTMRTVRVRRDNLFTFDDRVEIAAESLKPGEHKIEVSRAGKGAVYWGAYLQWFDTAERITAGGNLVAVERQYHKLTPVEFQNTRTVWKDGKRVEETFKDLKWDKTPLAFGEEIATGEQVEVSLKFTLENNSEYLVFEDPKPAGCEPVELRSGYVWGGFGANMELRDTKVAFFATYLGRGEHTLSYRLRCEQPGTFRVLPSSAEGMYTPFLQAISDSGKMTITTEPEKKE